MIGMSLFIYFYLLFHILALGQKLISAIEMSDKKLLGHIDSFVNPERSEDDHADALNSILIGTSCAPLPPPQILDWGEWRFTDVSLTTGINSGDTAIQSLVEHMSDYLPNKDDVIRGRGNYPPQCFCICIHILLPLLGWLKQGLNSVVACLSLWQLPFSCPKYCSGCPSCI